VHKIILITFPLIIVRAINAVVFSIKVLRRVLSVKHNYFIFSHTINSRFLWRQHHWSLTSYRALAKAINFHTHTPLNWIRTTKQIVGWSLHPSCMHIFPKGCSHMPLIFIEK
jgi:hypothetical protein